MAQLRTWGQYGRAAELCRETLTWVTPGSQEDAMFCHQLGILAQLRGDYDAAEPLYRRSLEINERIGDQAGMSASAHSFWGLITRTAATIAAHTLLLTCLTEA